jgi:hypothetical protein
MFTTTGTESTVAAYRLAYFGCLNCLVVPDANDTAISAKLAQLGYLTFHINVSFRGIAPYDPSLSTIALPPETTIEEEMKMGSAGAAGSAK